VTQLDEPRGAHAVHGHIVDVDAHVMLDAATTSSWAGRELGEWVARFTRDVTPEVAAAARARSDDDVWAVRGWLGYGAADPDDRVRALDRMGVARQFVFPPVTLPALIDHCPDVGALLRRYNDAVVDWASAAPTRLFPVLQLPCHDADAMREEAEHAVARGARAVEIGFATPPAGCSPADPALDPMWSTLAAGSVAVMLHVGGGGPGGALWPERPFLDPAWGAAPTLRHPELGGLLAGPFDLATLHLPAQVFLSVMVLGGVLTRHPNLAVGVMELGAAWVPSWVAGLDQAATGFRRFGLPLPAELPSEVVRRQVRVSPFNREPVASYLQSPGLSEVFAFSTDYPHSEGGRNPVNRLAATLEPLGADVLEQFFVGNGSRLLPAA
jgi:predicted TIM-barrel fold metal-dependent hydrolase